MKVKKMENFQNIRGLNECKWSSLNAPSTENPLSHSVLKFEEFTCFASPCLLSTELCGAEAERRSTTKQVAEPFRNADLDILRMPPRSGREDLGCGGCGKV